MLQESHECYWRYLYYVLTDKLGVWEMILMSEWEKEWMKNCKLLSRNGLQRTKRKCYEVSLTMCYEMFLRWSFPKFPGLKCYEMTMKCYEVSPRGGSASVFQVEILCSILKWSALKWPWRKCSEMSWDEMLQNLLCSVVKNHFAVLGWNITYHPHMKCSEVSSDEMFWSVLVYRWSDLTSWSRKHMQNLHGITLSNCTTENFSDLNIPLEFTRTWSHARLVIGQQ